MVELDRLDCEQGHLAFVEKFFAAKEGQQFVVGPHHKVMAKTLDRVISGEITRLIINVPPGYTKTEMAVVHFMARGLAINPRARFIHASFNGQLALHNSNSVREVIQLEEYQEIWPVGFSATTDAKGLWRTEELGGVMAAAAGGPITGFRAGLMGPGFTGALIIDDPLKPDDAESPVERPKINGRWHSTFKSRLAGEHVPVIVIMQRLHVDDFSGFLLTGGAGCRWHHLLLPIVIDNTADYPREYTHGDPIKHGLPDGPLWAAKHTLKQIDELRHNAYVFAAQYQQLPDAESGSGIIRRDWWAPYKSSELPTFEFVLASLDTAYGEKEENDFSALTVWGVYMDAGNVPRVLLIRAWQEKLAIHDLVQKVMDTVEPLAIDRLLIEAKASGTSVNQELRRMYGVADFGVHMINPGRLDKVARAHAVAHLFAEGIVQALFVDGLPRRSAALVIDQCSRFPKSSHDDLVDSTTQGLKHLRDIGLLTRAAERADAAAEEVRYKGPSVRRVYPV